MVNKPHVHVVGRVQDMQATLSFIRSDESVCRKSFLFRAPAASVRGRIFPNRRKLQGFFILLFAVHS